jgi:hypothetical protein
MAIPGDVVKIFRSLNLNTACCKSKRTPKYNCIAFAVGDTNQWWWPDEDGHWPDGVKRELSLEAFVATYATKDYLPCTSSEPEEGYHKVAIYGRGQVPSHAAQQLPDGRWASKLGQWEDIEHESLSELAEYGEVLCFLRRPLEKVPLAQQEPTQRSGEFS